MHLLRVGNKFKKCLQGIFLLCLIPLLSTAQSAENLSDGDFLFLDLNCGSLCDAIEAVTEGAGGRKFSHLGMVRKKGDSVYVLEAMGSSVRETNLGEFLAYSPLPALHARLKPAYRKLIPAALAYAQLQLGKPYDDAFLPDNGKFYCSELIYEAFRDANSGKPFFQNEPMTFKKPGSSDFFPVWVSYYEKLGIKVPEGVPGCNPGGISRSPYLETIGNFSPAPGLQKR